MKNRISGSGPEKTNNWEEAEKMDAKMLNGKVAIVSGASYGMGYSMAELFAKEGARVVMTARGKEKLDTAVKSIRDQGSQVPPM